MIINLVIELSSSILSHCSLRQNIKTVNLQKQVGPLRNVSPAGVLSQYISSLVVSKLQIGT